MAYIHTRWKRALKRVMSRIGRFLKPLTSLGIVMDVRWEYVLWAVGDWIHTSWERSLGYFHKAV